MSARSDPQRDLDSDNEDESCKCQTHSPYAQLEVGHHSCARSRSISSSTISSTLSSSSASSQFGRSHSTSTSSSKRARPRPKLSLYAIQRHMNAPKTIDPLPRSPGEVPPHTSTHEHPSADTDTALEHPFIAPILTHSAVLTNSLIPPSFAAYTLPSHSLPSLTPRSHYEFNTKNGPISIPFDDLPSLITPPLGLAQLGGFFTGAFLEVPDAYI